MLIPVYENPAAEFAKLPKKLRDRIRRMPPMATACWLWLGPRHYKGTAGTGYGRVHWDGSNQLVHRVVYKILVGPIPPELPLLDHVKKRGCVYRHCCRGDHLEPVTHTVNMMRGDRYAWRDPEPETCDVPF